MRNYLIIGEVARLLNMSTSQIRFYERKKLIEPKLLDENGYRLYDYDQLNRLVVINRLRELNMSISEIREFLSNSQEYSDPLLLKKIKESLQEDIKKMMSKLQQVEGMLSQYNKFEAGITSLIDIPERNLYVIDENKPTNIHPKEVYNFVIAQDLDYLDSNAEIIEIVGPIGSRLYCFHHKDLDKTFNLGRYKLTSGTYFSMNMMIDNIMKIDEAFNKFEKKALDSGYELHGDKIIIQDLNRIVYSSGHTHITLQRLVRNS